MGWQVVRSVAVGSVPAAGQAPMPGDWGITREGSGLVTPAIGALALRVMG